MGDCAACPPVGHGARAARSRTESDARSPAPRATPRHRRRLAESIGRAILLGLGLALARGHEAVEVCSDSRLAIAALEGRQPDDPGLAALVADIHAIAGGFAAVRWSWHPRTANEAADSLVRDLLWS